MCNLMRKGWFILSHLDSQTQSSQFGYSLIGAFSFDITISNILLGFAKFSYYHISCKSSISPSPNMKNEALKLRKV